MKLNKQKSIILACVLGLSLAFTGCKGADETANQAAEATQAAVERGGELAQQGAENAQQATENAVEAGKEALASGLDAASEAFDSTMEVTADTAAAAQEKFQGAVTGMEEQFNTMKEKMDAPTAAELQGKLDSVKTKLEGVKDKTGAELATALNEVRSEGSALATDLKNFRDQSMGGDAQPDPALTPGVAVTPSDDASLPPTDTVAPDAASTPATP